ncbi:SH3 domain-containing protein [Actinoallomurus spadix]|uniref:SH3b domain-containing protein n=1 Tax=Actinoallomurus spadix TaxID=79912 RepID=A0ABP3FTW5_9ACTN|nr:SH3 domain-containing protein [Actinoallomurus spadix]MCO5986131.1 SH3 domain-containing protein [Actinoallomurus spadix]
MNLRNRAVAVVTAVTIGAGGILAMGATAEAAVRPAAAHVLSAHAYRVVGVRKGHELTVRAAANAKSRVVGHLAAGAATTGTGRSSRGYLEVRAGNGKTGWVPAKNLETIEVKRH